MELNYENWPKWIVTAGAAFGVLAGFFWRIFTVETTLKDNKNTLAEHSTDLQKLRIAFPHIMASPDEVPTLLTSVEHKAMCAERAAHICEKLDKIQVSLANRMDKMDNIREDSRKEQSQRDERLFTVIGRVEEHLNKGGQ